MPKLPIDSVIPELLNRLQQRPNVVLQAPPGAGKTTRVPVSALGQTWLEGKKILMLEPRRIAARSAAYWIAHSLNEEVGRTVGYRVRMESKISNETKIEIVTEGILTRLIQSDPELAEYGMIIFDEFHERSLQTDLGLALCLDAQENLRPQLRILVMSATLDCAPIAALLGDAPIVSSEGRCFDITTHYFDADVSRRLDDTVVQAVKTALKQEPGSILVFLPGTGEIKRIERRLNSEVLPAGTSVYPLYADLPRDQQELAIETTRIGKRKIVLATSIAETSLTIEGVRVVIDSGLQRSPQFDPNTGMSRLVTTRVSKAAADQRRGRAGRTEAGVCYRLWSETVQSGLLPFSAPEITQADLTPLALDLANWGISEPTQLLWLEPPNHANYEKACSLLIDLGALNKEKKITPHGRDLNKLGTHPRLAHMILKGKNIGHGSLACDVAALLEERDIIRGEKNSVDLQQRIDAIHQPGANVDRAARERVRENSRRWAKQLGITNNNRDTDLTGVLVAFAYPDRVGQQRSNSHGRFRLSNGRGATINESDPLASKQYLAVAHLDIQGPDAKIFLAAEISLDDITQYFSERCRDRTIVDWDSEKECVIAIEQTVFGELVLREKILLNVDDETKAQALLKGIRGKGLTVLPWTPTLRQWQRRVMCLRQALGEIWPDVSDQQLINTLDKWLGPFLIGVSRFSQLENIDLSNALTQILGWERSKKLDELAPTHIIVPSGSKIPIDYQQEERPVLAVRLQEMFGLANTPTIANGKITLSLHLLSPAHRPVQVTQDLANFWANTYAEVKKELKGRYPKHVWPDDPLLAQATHRAKPRSTK